MQYYTLMKIKNKMKDFDVESEEWWEVAQEYFAKELAKHLVQHRANEISMRYKLDVYQRNFIDFFYGSPTSTKTLSQNEENETRPNGIARGEEVQIEEPQVLKGEGQEKKEPRTTQEQKHMHTTPTTQAQ